MVLELELLTKALGSEVAFWKALLANSQLKMAVLCAKASSK